MNMRSGNVVFFIGKLNILSTKIEAFLWVHELKSQNVVN